MSRLPFAQPAVTAPPGPRDDAYSLDVLRKLAAWPQYYATSEALTALVDAGLARLVERRGMGGYWMRTAAGELAAGATPLQPSPMLRAMRQYADDADAREAEAAAYRTTCGCGRVSQREDEPCAACSNGGES